MERQKSPTNGMRMLVINDLIEKMERIGHYNTVGHLKSERKRLVAGTPLVPKVHLERWL